MKFKFPSAGLTFLVSATLTLFGHIFCASSVRAQGENSPTGAAGSYSGSIATGGGSFDPYERNASRSITDMVVPGAVVPFTYTRIWNSRSGWRDNWSWGIQVHDRAECGNGCGVNDLFFGYYVNYPDGRRVQFNKPGDVYYGAPGTYGSGIHDRFVIDPGSTQGHLYMEDGSILNFALSAGLENDPIPTSLVDPHGRVITFTYDYNGGNLTVTEPAGRWIRIHSDGSTKTITSSLGQSVINDSYETVTYNDVIDSANNLPVQAHYEYEAVSPPPLHPSPTPYPFSRMIHASDPMFDGPLQQIKYVYVDKAGSTDWTASNNDPSMACVLEERFAANSTDPGVMVDRVEMPPNTFGTETYYTRKETHGDGAVRTISYWNPTVVHTVWNSATNSYQQVTGIGQNFFDHVTDFTNNLSVIERHEYDSTHAFSTPIKITDMRGNVTQQTLELNLGKITQETHPDNYYQSWTYTDPANPYYVATDRDELGNVTTFLREPAYQPAGLKALVTQINYPDGSNETFRYNSLGQVTSHHLPSGATETKEYDGRGLLQREYNDVDGYAARKEYTYESWDRVSTVQDGRARLAGAAYSMKYEYNGRHQITKTHYPATGGSSDPTVINVYDMWGRCISTTNEVGNTTTMTYDDYGRMTSKTEPLNAPAWNGTGTVASRTWNWTYERVRNGVTYDAHSHVNKEWRTQIEPAFDSAGNRRMTVREYDVNNRLVTEQSGWVVSASGGAAYSPDGETHYFDYDVNGNKIKYTDPFSRITTYGYDARNRLFTTTDPLNYVTTTDYDAASNKTKVTFPDLKTQQWQYFDAWGQPRVFIDERGDIANLDYWPWGPMKKLAGVTTHRDKDSGGTEDQHTSIYPDGLGRPQQTQFPDNSWERTFYEFGQIKTCLTRKGAIKTISYDARGRETSHTWSDSTPGIMHTWDDASRVTSLANSVSTINYTYDQSGQVISESNSIAGAVLPATISYSRYPDGATSVVTYPNQSRIRRNYTARGQLASTGSADATGNWLTQFIQYSYNADSTVNYQYYANGVLTAFAYDWNGLMNIAFTYRVAPYQNFSFRYFFRDNRNRISWWVKSGVNDYNQLENSRGDRYSYDNEGQLSAASYEALNPDTTPNNAQRTESFVYDQLGNRKGANTLDARGSVTFARRDNGLNQYTSWTPPMAATNYDTNGVLTNEGSTTGTYNALNQPITISTATTSTTFGYDPLGRCVKRTTPSATTYLYYENWNLIQEGANPLVADRTYVHGNRVDEIIASQTATATYYHHYDARGHGILITDNNASLVEQYDYDAFGKAYFYNGSGAPLPNGSGIGNRFLFTGREWLSDLKLYDFRNRMYQPELGRFLQPDPKEFEAGDYNIYRYCHNDPVNKSDPTGLGEGPVREKLVRHIVSTENRAPRCETISVPVSAVMANVSFGQVSAVPNSQGQKVLDSKTYSMAIASGSSIKNTLVRMSQNDWQRKGWEYSSEVIQNRQDPNQVKILQPTRGVSKDGNTFGTYIHREQVDEKHWRLIAHIFTQVHSMQALRGDDKLALRQAQVAGIIVFPEGTGVGLIPYNPPKN